MNEWYKAWFGSELNDMSMAMTISDDMKKGMEQMDQKNMSMLENAPDFDKEFLAQMIGHHQMAISLSQLLVQGTTRPEMKQLGEDIISAQMEEIEMMQEWQSKWGY